MEDLCKCEDCGKVFDYEDRKIVEETHGFDHPPYEKFSYCPYCGGDFVEALECESCGTAEAEENLLFGLCENCVKEKVKDFLWNPQKCFDFAKKHEATCVVEINSFLYGLFTTSEINEILLREIMEKHKIFPVDCSSFVKDDTYWLLENLIEDEKKGGE